MREGGQTNRPGGQAGEMGKQVPTEVPTGEEWEWDGDGEGRGKEDGEGRNVKNDGGAAQMHKAGRLDEARTTARRVAHESRHTLVLYLYLHHTQKLTAEFQLQLSRFSVSACKQLAVVEHTKLGCQGSRAGPGKPSRARP